MVAELVVHVADAVPGGGLALAVAQLPHEFQGPLARDESPFVVAELALVPADRVERAGLPVAVVDRPEEFVRPLGVRHGLFHVAPVLVQLGQVEVARRLADVVVEPAVQLQGLLEMGTRGVEVAQPDVHDRDGPVRERLPGEALWELVE